MTLEDRIERLESQNRRLKCVTLTSLCLIGLAVASGAQQAAPPEKQQVLSQMSAGVIKAQRIEAGEIVVRSLGHKDTPVVARLHDLHGVGCLDLEAISDKDQETKCRLFPGLLAMQASNSMTGAKVFAAIQCVSGGADISVHDVSIDTSASMSTWRGSDDEILNRIRNRRDGKTGEKSNKPKTQ